MSVARHEPLSPEQFAQAENVSRETLDRLRRYVALLERWQGRINLVGRSTLEDPWRRHLQDSAQLASLVEGIVVVDLGSGAGLPGLILAIMRPELEVHLIESDSRKCAFLREAARATGAKPVIHNFRIEAVAPFSSDVVTARALAPLGKLLDLAVRFTPKQCLFLKGEEAERELTESSRRWSMAVERIPSRSDPRGVILRLSEISFASHIRHRQSEGRSG